MPYKDPDKQREAMRRIMRERRARRKAERRLLRKVLSPIHDETRIHVRLALELYLNAHHIATDPLLSDAEKVSRITYDKIHVPPYFLDIIREIAKPVNNK